MKKLFFCLLISCLITSTFAQNLKGVPSLSCGIKFNNPSTKLAIYANDDNWHNLIDWAGLESAPSVAIDFDYEWYHNNYPVYFGIVTDLDIGNINVFGLGFKTGYYNKYVNLFFKLGLSGLIAKMDAGRNVRWSIDGGNNYYKINSVGFNGISYNFGFGLDVHPSKKPFFVRLAYSYESCIKPNVKINTSQFTDKWKSSDINGGTNFSNNSFTISVGWQFGRTKILYTENMWYEHTK